MEIGLDSDALISRRSPPSPKRQPSALHPTQLEDRDSLCGIVNVASGGHA